MLLNNMCTVFNQVIHQKCILAAGNKKKIRKKPMVDFVHIIQNRNILKSLIYFS